MDLSLKGKTALVSGSTQGIGKAAAVELAALGARVILLARDENKLIEVSAQLSNKDNQEHDYLVADFSKPTQVGLSVAEFIKDQGPIHILVNNTGGPPAGKAIDAEIEEFEVAFKMHLICNHILAQALVPGMKEEKFGRIINVISTSVKQPLGNLGVSNTIRAAVANWSKTLAGELGQFNITVNNVLPGATNTGRLKSIIQNKADKTGASTDAVMDEMSAAVPMKRVAEPEEIAHVIAFLASPAASYVNGINVPVDGGRTGCL